MNAANVVVYPEFLVDFAFSRVDIKLIAFTLFLFIYFVADLALYICNAFISSISSSLFGVGGSGL